MSTLSLHLSPSAVARPAAPPQLARALHRGRAGVAHAHGARRDRPAIVISFRQILSLPATGSTGATSISSHPWARLSA
jgi:hypothetical protein